MVLRGMLAEDFVNYRLPSMYLAFPFCTLKCNKLNGGNVCQNMQLMNDPKLIVISTLELCKQFIDNPISEAIVCAGLEPLDSIDDVLDLIKAMRQYYQNESDIVIYTGYTEEEVLADEKMRQILNFSNIVVKYGRYLINDTPHHDEILGVNLASSNQYAKRYNYNENR